MVAQQPLLLPHLPLVACTDVHVCMDRESVSSKWAVVVGGGGGAEGGEGKRRAGSRRRVDKCLS